MKPASKEELWDMLKEANPDFASFFERTISTVEPRPAKQDAKKKEAVIPSPTDEYDMKRTAAVDYEHCLHKNNIHGTSWIRRAVYAEKRMSELAAEVEAARKGGESIANFHCRNESFWHDLVMQCAAHLGPDQFVSDDGSVQDKPLALKIPGMVGQAVKRVQELAAEVEILGEKISDDHERIESLKRVLCSHEEEMRELGYSRNESNNRWQRLAGSMKELESGIQQTLGQVLGFPWYMDDKKKFPNATRADGVCVGEETAASLATMAADRICGQIEEISKLKLDNDSYKKDVQTLREQKHEAIADLSKAQETIKSLGERCSGQAELLSKRAEAHLNTKLDQDDELDKADREIAAKNQEIESLRTYVTSLEENMNALRKRYSELVDAGNAVAKGIHKVKAYFIEFRSVMFSGGQALKIIVDKMGETS